MWITRRRSLARMDSPAHRGIMNGMSGKQKPWRQGEWNVIVGLSADDGTTLYVLAAGRLPRCGRLFDGLGPGTGEGRLDELEAALDRPRRDDARRSLDDATRDLNDMACECDRFRERWRVCMPLATCPSRAPV